MIQLRLKVPVRRIRTDNGTKFVSQTLREYYEKVGISDLSFVAVFGVLCYPTNDSENLGKLQPKADIGPALHEMASDHSSSGPTLHEMTPVSISSGLVPNPSPSTQFVPPSRFDWDFL
ncbi:retrovirus-related pol polyprotein from transposon TNT 1-94, partial [Tanacetum coccineum]